jgi:hypothetical protein
MRTMFFFRGAHASRVLVSASGRNNLFHTLSPAREYELPTKACVGVTPTLARETRALPGGSAFHARRE